MIVAVTSKFIKSFDIQKVIEDMEENSNLKHVRFNKRKNIKAGFDSIMEILGFIFAIIS